MRARRREINIFNMSLLDILCGALGAFCFMMIVALPYYIPPGKSRDLRKAQEETQKLMRDLEQMKTKMPDQKSVEEMEELMRRLEAQVNALQGQVNILTAEKMQLSAEKAQLAAENQALRAKSQSLEEANQKLSALLQAKKPFTIVASGDDFGQGIDVILFKSSVVEKGRSPLFDSWLKGQYNNFHTVRNAMLYGRAVAIFVIEDSPPGSEGKVFLRLTDEPERRKKTEVQGAISGDETLSPPVRLPQVTLFPERYWILVGTVTIDQNYQLNFKEATEAEREAAWQTLTGSAPPPTPTPPPPPTDAERAKFEAQRIKLQEAHKKLSRLMQIPLDDSGQHDAEILQLADEMLKELPARDNLRREVQFRRERVLEMQARREHRSPSQSPAPTPQQKSPPPGPVPRP